MSPLPPPYIGPTVATEVLLNSLFMEHFDVKHLDTSDHRPLSTMGRIDLINIYLAFKQYALLFWRLLAGRSELVYIPISQTTLGYLRDVPFIVLSRLFSKKIILHLRGGYFREFYNASNRLMRSVIRVTLRMVDKMVVLGDCLRPLFDGLLSPEKIAVVPNGRDLPELSAAGMTSPPGSMIVLFLSNLIKEKGYWDVLEAAKEVLNEVTNVQFIFAGAWTSDKERRACEDFVRDTGLAGHVEFTGPVSGERKYQLLRTARVFVLPTYYPPEGHPWAIIEAMAAGVPVISTDHGAIRESVIHGENGFLVGKQSPHEIAGKLLVLLRDSELRDRMGRRSRELYLSRFTSDHFVNNIISVFHEVLGG